MYDYACLWRHVSSSGFVDLQVDVQWFKTTRRKVLTLRRSNNLIRHIKVSMNMWTPGSHRLYRDWAFLVRWHTQTQQWKISHIYSRCHHGVIKNESTCDWLDRCCSFTFNLSNFLWESLCLSTTAVTLNKYLLHRLEHIADVQMDIKLASKAYRPWDIRKSWIFPLVRQATTNLDFWPVLKRANMYSAIRSNTFTNCCVTQSFLRHIVISKRLTSTVLVSDSLERKTTPVHAINLAWLHYKSDHADGTNAAVHAHVNFAILINAIAPFQQRTSDGKAWAAPLSQDISARPSIGRHVTHWRQSSKTSSNDNWKIRLRGLSEN